MRRALVFLGLGLVLAGCGRPESRPVEMPLAADPARLHALVTQCRAGQHDAALCARATQANRQRFFSGRSGPDEYRTLAELPSIPASFDGPAEEGTAP